MNTTLKTTLAASAVAMAGLAGSASAQELTNEQEQALSIMQTYNTCVEEGYVEINQYYTSIQQYAEDNGYLEQFESLVEQLDAIEAEAVSDGIITQDEIDAYDAVDAQIYALEVEVIAAAAAEGIVEPNPFPEEPCFNETQQEITATGKTLAEVESDLESAYNTLGQDEFLNRVAPSLD